MLPFARLGADKPMGGVPTRDLFLRSLSLDSHGDYLEIPNVAQLHFGGAMTIEGWLRPEGLVAARQGIFFKGAAPHLEPFPNLEYSLWLRNGGHLQLASTPQGHSGKLALETSIPAIRVGQWQHFAAVIDGAQARMQIYVNGFLQAEGGYGASGIKLSGGNLKIGTCFDQCDFAGQIDEVRSG